MCGVDEVEAVIPRESESGEVMVKVKVMTDATSNDRRRPGRPTEPPHSAEDSAWVLNPAHATTH